MSYRDAPDSIPLLLTVRRAIIALDAERGTLRWQQPLRLNATRHFLVGQTVLVTQGTGTDALVSCFDVNSGEPGRSFLLGFEVTSGLVQGDLLILSGRSDAVCITKDGALLWSAAPEKLTTNAWSGESKALLVCRDPSGSELWRLELDDNGNGDVGLLWGELVSQPHLR